MLRVQRPAGASTHRDAPMPDAGTGAAGGDTAFSFCQSSLFSTEAVMPVGKTWSEGDASTRVFDEAAVDDDEIGTDVDVDGDGGDDADDG